ncbi:MAG: response regulator [Planctomycetes bacterium]|nr:response regulator [Planctomycetota bacterium]
MADKKILLVDDEKDILVVLRKQLEDKGYEVFTAENGIDALQIASVKEPDIAILDLALPDMDGSEIAVKLRENEETKHLPVIFLTALRSKQEEHDGGTTIGGHTVLAKPYDLEEIVERIEVLA